MRRLAAAVMKYVSYGFYYAFRATANQLSDFPELFHFYGRGRFCQAHAKQKSVYCWHFTKNRPGSDFLSCWLRFSELPKAPLVHSYVRTYIRVVLKNQMLE